MFDMTAEQERMAALLDQASGLLSGISLRDLGYLPRRDELPSGELDSLEPAVLAIIDSVSAEERAASLCAARLLAGVLWHSSVIVVDKLFEDLGVVTELTGGDAGDIDDTTVLRWLPPRFRFRYDARFAKRFLAVMVDTTGLLARGWEAPGCVAQELAVRCLLNQVQVTADLYHLPLPSDWRETLENVLMEDAHSDLLYRRDLDGFEDDPELITRLGLAPMHFDLWFEPFNDSFHVTPFAR